MEPQEDTQRFPIDPTSGPTAEMPTFRQVLASGATDRGRVRAHNEDQFVVAEMTRAMHIKATSLPQSPMKFGDMRVRGQLFVVADGMGGHRGGEQASAIAVVAIEDFLLNTLRWFFRLQGDNVIAEFQLALRAADDQIFAEAARRPDLRGMGTTVTLAYCVDHILYVAHAGDSRLYILRGGILYRITHDHTVAGELERRHLIEPEQAAKHPLRNVITNSVGGDKPGVTAEVHKILLEVNDVVLLCSDGLTEVVPDAEIADILVKGQDPDADCLALLQRANALGGPDNVTAIVARFLA